jgi:choline kinase
MLKLADKAVILAAGQGNRMGGRTPKPLLPLSGREGDACFLDWHLTQLHRFGVRKSTSSATT